MSVAELVDYKIVLVHVYKSHNCAFYIFLNNLWIVMGICGSNILLYQVSVGKIRSMEVHVYMSKII
jgi:hypothetical protein